VLENDYREMYVSEGLEQIEIINNALLKLETEPDKSEHIDSIFRSVHSLKGMAATMDYEQTRELCKNIEDTFDDLRKGNSKLSIDLTNALFKCIVVLTMSFRTVLINDASSTIKTVQPRLLITIPPLFA